MDSTEHRVARHLQTRVATPAAVPAQLLERLRREVARRRARRRALAIAVSVTGGVAAVAAATWLGAVVDPPSSPNPAGTSHSPDESPPSRTARTEPVPPPPVAPRGEFTLVWTGSQVILWGGSDNVVSSRDTDAPDTRYLGDGASYTPSSNTWARLPRAPLAGRSHHEAVWTGEEMIVLGGLTAPGTTSRQVAAFNPGTGRWRALADLPFHAGPSTPSNVEAVWAGDRLVVWDRDTDLVYSSGSGVDSWQRLPPPGLPGSSRGGALRWDGDRVIALAGAQEGLLHAAVLDRSDTWRQLDPLDFSTADVAADPSSDSSAVTGGAVVVWSDNEGAPTYRLAPGSADWQRLGPARFSACEGSGRPAVIAAGLVVLGCDGGTGGNAFFDPDRRAWSTLRYGGLGGPAGPGAGSSVLERIGTDADVILVGIDAGRWTWSRITGIDP